MSNVINNVKMQLTNFLVIAKLTQQSMEHPVGEVSLLVSFCLFKPYFKSWKPSVT